MGKLVQTKAPLKTTGEADHYVDKTMKMLNYWTLLFDFHIDTSPFHNRFFIELWHLPESVSSRLYPAQDSVSSYRSGVDFRIGIAPFRYHCPNLPLHLP